MTVLTPATEPPDEVHCSCRQEQSRHWNLTHLLSVMRPYPEYAWDQTLRSATNAYAATADPTRRAVIVRDWLNLWLCRLSKSPQSTRMFAHSFNQWVQVAEPLIGTFQALADLTDGDIEVLEALYWDLAQRPGAVRADGVVRAIGPTAAAKVMMFLYPETVPAWDQAIRDRVVEGGGDQRAYGRYLRWARGAAQCLEDQLTRSGSAAMSVGDFLRRGPASTAYIIDTAGYLNIQP